jgi:hypothetical protein
MPPSRRFVPRATLLLLAGLALFFAVATLYALPALLEPAPAGAIVDYHTQRVLARLEGKVHWMLIGSMVTVVAIGVACMRRDG